MRTTGLQRGCRSREPVLQADIHKPIRKELMSQTNADLPSDTASPADFIEEPPVEVALISVATAAGLGLFCALSLLSHRPSDVMDYAAGSAGGAANPGGRLGALLAYHLYGLYGVGAWALVLGLLAVGGLVCAALKARWRMSASAWLILLVVCAAILIGGPASTPRFRLPVEPLISAAAALVFARAAARVRPDRRGG